MIWVATHICEWVLPFNLQYKYSKLLLLTMEVSFLVYSRSLYHVPHSDVSANFHDLSLHKESELELWI